MRSVAAVVVRVSGGRGEGVGREGGENVEVTGGEVVVELLKAYDGRFEDGEGEFRGWEG